MNTEPIWSFDPCRPDRPRLVGVIVSHDSPPETWETICKGCNVVSDGRHERCPECDNDGQRWPLWHRKV